MPGQLHPYTRPLVAVVPRSGSEFSTLFFLDFIYLLGSTEAVTAETTEAGHQNFFKNFSRIFLFWLPSDLQAGPAPNIPRLGYATPYIASGYYADHVAPP